MDSSTGPRGQEVNNNDTDDTDYDNLLGFFCWTCKTTLIAIPDYLRHDKRHEIVYICKKKPRKTQHAPIVIENVYSLSGEMHVFNPASAVDDAGSPGNDLTSAVVKYEDLAVNDHVMDTAETQGPVLTNKTSPESQNKSVKNNYCKTHNKAVYKRKRLANSRKSKANRPFKCSVCDSGFKTKWHLVDHEFIHSDKKRYECVLCSKGFRRKSELNNHMVSSHHTNPCGAL